MGTSKSFSETKHSMIPNWGTLSSSLTTNCNATTLPAIKLNTILSNYVTALGGASVAGRGNSKIGGRSAIKTAKKIGSFFSTFATSGNNIRETLKSIGVKDIENKSVSDIINHLIDYCSETASTIDANAAKEASRLLFEELIARAENIEEIETLLSNRFEINTSEDLIIKYFGYYVFEHLSKWFYEHLIKEKNEADCNSLFRQIKDFIFVRIEGMQKNNPLQNIDWGSKDADRLIKNIQQDILTVFQ